MKIKTISHAEYIKSVPSSGQHILAQQTEENVLVYQAYNHNIAEFAVANQKFGGNHFSFTRMTWIKPNFLWMMYRCGWAEKVNQERVLGIWISKAGFTKILQEAAYSSFKADIYESREIWREELNNKDVRLQWDPDHDIYGEKEERRAIQLGLKNNLVKEYNNEMIQEIIDVTEFVKAQKQKINEGNLEDLTIPEESIFKTDIPELNKKLMLA